MLDVLSGQRPLRPRDWSGGWVRCLQAAKYDCRARLRVSDRVYVMSRRVRVVAGVWHAVRVVPAARLASTSRPPCSQAGPVCAWVDPVLWNVCP